MGRQILGAISGLFFGLFLAIDLVMFGVIRFESALVLLLPIIGAAAGIGLAIWRLRQVDSASITSDGA